MFRPESLDLNLKSRLLALSTIVITAIITSIPLSSRFTNAKPSRSSMPTAWLDGLRGFASFFVSFYHLRNGFTNDVHLSYGTGSDGANDRLLQLPFLRLLFAGPAMVTVFFLVSGYSLCWGSFNDLQTGKVGKCMERIRSSIFRRWLRLYLPTIASSFVVLLCLILGFYDKGTEMDARSGYREPMPTHFSSAIGQAKDWAVETVHFMNIWGEGENRHLYYPHSWSIPVEFTCSIILYVAMIAIAKLRLVPRLALLGIAILYTYWTAWFHLWTFFVGALLAQLNAYRLVQHNWVNGYPPETSRRKTVVKIFIFMWGAYLLSYPDWQWDAAPGYKFLSPVLPDWREPFWFIQGLGTMLMVWTASDTLAIQKVLSSELARYLGRISFSLYLVHGIVIHVVALWLIPMIWEVTGKDTVPRFELGFFLAASIHVPITFFAAELFTKMFDNTAVQFAKWVEMRLSVLTSEAEYHPLPREELPLTEMPISTRLP